MGICGAIRHSVFENELGYEVEKYQVEHAKDINNKKWNELSLLT